MDLEITLRVNGTAHQLSVDTRTTLLDALRERLGITGPKDPSKNNVVMLGGVGEDGVVPLAVERIRL